MYIEKLHVVENFQTAFLHKCDSQMHFAYFVNTHCLSIKPALSVCDP